MEIGGYAFGKPVRITASVALGKSGIINVERESNLSGRFHDKGVQIISGYLRRTFAQDKPLSLSASVCFEQSYSGVDGDSASSTEIYALLSALVRNFRSARNWPSRVPSTSRVKFSRSAA